MCGIAGFTHGRRAAAPGRIQDAIASIAHRGPNQQGVYESEVVSLGAARLKIIDIEGGDQPIVSEYCRTVIVFNGEIYNHLELRRELEERGYRFRSHSDTETVLNAFLEWDTECFSRLRGMFAVALWCESDRRLVLARDRMGIKPLYIARRGDDLYFGSELKAILVHPEIERCLSPDGLDCYLSLNYVPAPWTLVEGIEKLLPGQWMEWRRGAGDKCSIRTDRYWSLPSSPPLSGKDARWTPREAEAELDRLLTQSVQEHLVSDVPLGVWLSGGLDSSSLVHYAAAASSSRLKTFSISFRGRRFDESNYARQVANYYGTDHTEFDLNPEQDLPAAIQELAYYCDEPNADSGALPVWFLSRLTKASATVALSGEGADELFGGYLMQRASLLARGVRRLPPPAVRAMLAMAQRWPVSNDKIGFEYKLKRFLEGCRMSAARAHVHWSGTFDDREKRSLIQSTLPPALDSVLNELAGDHLQDYLRFDQKYFLPDNILTKVDHTSMAHAVEVRPPFLDHRIVEFASSLPANMKIQGSRQKVILRNLMRGKLSPAILNRPKIGFDIPTHDWFRGPLRPLLEEAVAFASAEHGDFFQLSKIESDVRAHLDRRANLGFHLWGLMTLFFWMKRWKIQTRTPAESARPAMEKAFISTA